MDTKNSILVGAMAALSCIASNQVYAAAGDSSFTPARVIVPITEIALSSTDGNSSSLYSCTDTLAGCGIDITDSAALAALSVGSSIAAGTYDRIRVASCREEGGYSAILEGSIITGAGTTIYYTTTPAVPGMDDVLSTDSADLGPITLDYNGCSNEYLLSSPITVADGDSIVVNLFVNLENIAWARTADSSSIPSGCQNNSLGGDNQVVCMAYPDVVAYIGSATPSVQTYHVSNNGSGQVDGQFILMFNADGTPIGGFTRPYYDATNTASSGFDTPLRTFTLNDDGTTYTLGNYGGTVDSYDRLITDFVPGTIASDISAGNHDATSPRDAGVPYSATLQ